MKKILVTGGGGYIGRFVVKQLLDLGYTVISADVRNDGVDERAIRINASIFEERDNLYDFLHRPDVCLHMAWRNGFVHSADTHMGDLSAHYTFLKKMIDSGIKRIAVMGTMHEVGYWEGAIDENTPCNPVSQYGIAKNALRQSMIQLTKGTNTELLWLRAYYIVGDDLHNHSVFTKILERAREGAKEFPFTSGKNKCDFISVENLALEIALATVQDRITGIVNCCSGNPVSLREMVEAFLRDHQLDMKLNFGAFPARASDSDEVYGNAAKIREILHHAEAEYSDETAGKIRHLLDAMNKGGSAV